MDIKNFDSRFLTLKIDRILIENEDTRTYIFKHNLGAKPGQFVMLWLPGVDEKPFSVAYDDGYEFALTICKVGTATEKIFELKEGAKIGIRGPLGSFYTFEKGDNLILVAGGYGAAPMYFVAKEASKLGAKIDFIVGARSEKLLLYTDRLKVLGGVNLHLATNDGSAGKKGFVTDVLRDLLNQAPKNTKVFTCGPELMMKAVMDLTLSSNLEGFASVEKYMKCGIGICGQCSLDDGGELVCVKGPVMSFSKLKKSSEFGKYHRDAQGQKHYFNKISK